LVAARTRRYDFVWLEQLIAADLGELFPGMTIVGVYTFRVTRDAEMSIQELEADDLLETIEQGVLRRRFGSVVRLTVDSRTPDDVRRILLDNLDLEPEGLVAVPPPLGMTRRSCPPCPGASTIPTSASLPRSASTTYSSTALTTRSSR
jgi:polyphosphate kinase